MEDATEDPDESSSGTVSESYSEGGSTRSTNMEKGSTKSQKQRLRESAKGTVSDKFPKIIKKVQSVLEENSEGKKKGRKRTILVFYYRNDEKKKNPKHEEDGVPGESHTSNNASSLPGTSQDQEPSAASPAKRVRKWFFL
ncbi:uncharacterized protein LOC114706803 [Peromyscus leucopus]|uniref:uncharacterized protein LOC114706803 n=1 Tax=Peromyscus leucopus TaxID=10041 RepID=UPI0010A176DC|nr:uncharacterized protein LOC114706803 [Peromyscus leucopus]